MADTATLSYENNYTVFRYNGHEMCIRDSPSCSGGRDYWTFVGKYEKIPETGL